MLVIGYLFTLLNNTYDDANELTQTIQPDSSTLTTGYDVDGNAITHTDGSNHTTQYAYDVLNHLASVTDPLNRVTQYVYDPVGNLSSLTDAMSPARTTAYNYDAANELKTVTYSDGVTPNVSYTYSPSGRRLSMSDGTGTTTYSYDSRDRLSAVTNGAGQALSYGYDPVGNLTSITYPTSGQMVTRTYDELNRLHTIQDWLGHTIAIGWDDNSNLSSIAYPTSNSVSASYSYDAANGLTGITDSKLVSGVPTPFWTFSYTLDHLEQVRAASDPVQNNVQHTYTRNLLDQLTQDQRSGTGSGSTSWGYDAAYHITSRADTTANTSSTYSPDAADELTNLTTTTTQNTTYSYNRDGDRTGWSDTVSGKSASDSYDQADRLTGVSGTGVLTPTTYAYDGDGLRASKTANSTTTQATWDVAQGLPQLVQEGSTKYISGPNGTPIEQIDGSGNVRYYLADELGSVRGLIDTNGTITDSYSYDPYGARTVVTGSAGDTPFGYAGQYTDAETGFQYLRARYYDPATGQFLTRDPLAGLSGTPYAYTNDNPVNGSDPSGLCKVEVLGRCIVPDLGDVANGVQTLGNAISQTGSAAVGSYNSFRDQVRSSVYGQAFYTDLTFGAGFLDTLTGGRYSQIAARVGAPVQVCSFAYLGGGLYGQYFGALSAAEGLVNVALAGTRVADLAPSGTALADTSEAAYRYLGSFQRNTEPLTASQIEDARAFARRLGLPDENLQFFTFGGPHQRTAYAWNYDTVFVGPDLLPGTGTGLSANSMISAEGTLAHEIIGHRESFLAGKAYDDQTLLDEVQASWRAARLTPGLSWRDRYLLLRDVVERIQSAGLMVRDLDKSQVWFGRLE